MYNYSDLKWVKNVKRQQGHEWAYSEYSTGDFFELNWSVKMKGNVLKAGINELILIFQTLKSPKGTFLTHIVTPINDFISYDENTPKHPHTRTVCVIAKAEPLDSIPKPLSLDFYRPNRGAVCHLNTIKDFESKLDIGLKKLQIQIIGLFSSVDLELDQMINFMKAEIQLDEGFEEGERMEALHKHKYYERNSKVVKLAKMLAKNENRFFCEVCRFSFESTFPVLGEGFIECHHKTPIASAGIRNTIAQDLGIVCSNCHRMLHRRFDGVYLTISELRERFF